MVQNQWPAYKSQVVFEDLYWMQASLNRDLLLCARAAVHSVVVTDVKATRHTVGEEGSHGVVDLTTDA